MCLGCCLGKCLFGGACNEGLIGLIFYLLNVAFFFCGGAMLGVGIWVVVASPEFDVEGTKNNVLTMAIALICLGGFVFVVGFFGCCGIKKQSSCYLCLYLLLVSTAVATQVTLAILAAFFIDVGDKIQTSMENEVAGYGKGNEDLDGKWDIMQTSLSCCGANGPEDYLSNNDTDYTVPESCCSSEDNVTLSLCQEQARNQTANADLHEQGCYEAWKTKTEEYQTAIIWTVSVVAVIQATGIIFGCCLKSRLNKVGAG